jgi:hypothetical protein
MSRNDLVSKIVNNYKDQKTKIEYQEEPTKGYRQRTIKNAAADATFAFATDFSTSGERLTYTATIDQGKKYVSFNVNDISEENKKRMILNAINELNKCNAKTLNIAGNGIYTMNGKYTQQEVDAITFEILEAVITSPRLRTKIELIRSGGQTGFDEAGIKAGVRLGLPTLILAPNGWGFRDMSGIDTYNEVEFKKRFDTI